MPAGQGQTLYPPEAGIAADIANVFAKFEKETSGLTEAQVKEGKDYQIFKSIFRHFRLANIWRGRGSVIEILSVRQSMKQSIRAQLTDRLLSTVAEHLSYTAPPASDDEWHFLSYKQVATVYLLHAFYFLQSKDMLVKIRLSVRQIMELYIIFHALSLNERNVAQMAVFELVVNEAFVGAPFPLDYSPLLNRDLSQRCSWDAKISAYFTNKRCALEEHALSDAVHMTQTEMRRLSEEVLTGDGGWTMKMSNALRHDHSMSEPKSRHHHHSDVYDMTPIDMLLDRTVALVRAQQSTGDAQPSTSQVVVTPSDTGGTIKNDGGGEESMKSMIEKTVLQRRALLRQRAAEANEKTTKERRENRGRKAKVRGATVRATTSSTSINEDVLNASMAALEEELMGGRDVKPDGTRVDVEGEGENVADLEAQFALLDEVLANSAPTEKPKRKTPVRKKPVQKVVLPPPAADSVSASPTKRIARGRPTLATVKAQIDGEDTPSTSAVAGKSLSLSEQLAALNQLDELSVIARASKKTPTPGAVSKAVKSRASKMVKVEPPVEQTLEEQMAALDSVEVNPPPQRKSKPKPSKSTPAPAAATTQNKEMSLEQQMAELDSL